MLAFAIVLGTLCVIGARAAISYQVLDGNAAGLVEFARRCVEAHDCTSNGGEGRLGLFRCATTEFEVNSVAGAHPWNWLRHFIEVTNDNAHLLQP